MNLIIEAVKVGPLEVICYVLGCPATGHGMLIDPAAPSETVAQHIARYQLSIRWIVNTHGHADHTAGNEFWASKTGATTVIHGLDWKFFSTPEMQRAALAEGFPPLRQIDRQVQDGDRLPVGNFELTVLHTPGHSPGSICLYTLGHLFTGDTLFVDNAGRTDLPGFLWTTPVAPIYPAVPWKSWWPPSSTKFCPCRMTPSCGLDMITATLPRQR